MFTTVARMASALAIWGSAETAAIEKPTNVSSLKAVADQAANQFVYAAYAVCFRIAPYILARRQEITTISGTRYSAIREGAGSGLIVQKTSLKSGDPGITLSPTTASMENFLQLAIELPELLDKLGIR